MKRILDAVFVLGILLVAFAVLQMVDKAKPAKVEAFPIYEGSEVETRKLQPKLVYISTETVRLSAREKDCLARNVFYEAGVESKEGKLAVAQVTLNRVRDGRWGKDVCSVVYAKAQFSWTLFAKKRHAQPQGELWAESQAVVNEFLGGLRIERLDNVLHYHADYVNPKWADDTKVQTKVGQHIFYALN